MRRLPLPLRSGDSRAATVGGGAMRKMPTSNKGKPRQTKSVIAGRAADDRGRTNSKKSTFLIVENYEPLARALASILTNYGDVTVATSVQQARQTLTNGTYWDAAIFDILLQGGSGLDLLAEARSAFPTLRALVLTSSLDPEHMRAAYDLGAAFLPKPARRKQLERFGHAVASDAGLEEATNAWAARYGLTPMEKDLLQGAARGENREMTAQRRHRSTQTLKVQAASLLRKTGDLSMHHAIERILRELAFANRDFGFRDSER